MERKIAELKIGQQQLEGNLGGQKNKQQQLEQKIQEQSNTQQELKEKFEQQKHRQQELERKIEAQNNTQEELKERLNSTVQKLENYIANSASLFGKFSWCDNIIFELVLYSFIYHILIYKVYPLSTQTWSGNPANFKAFIMSCVFMLSWLRCAQIF